MTEASLTIGLVQRVMGWRPGDGRWITGPSRRWQPLSSFRPTERVQDALQLLEHAQADYTIASRGGAVVAEVIVAGRSARARGTVLPLALCQALAKALGVETEDAA